MLSGNKGYELNKDPNNGFIVNPWLHDSETKVMAVGVTGSGFFDLFWNLLREALQRAFNFAVLERFYHDIGIKDFSEKFVSIIIHTIISTHAKSASLITWCSSASWPLEVC